MTIVGGCSSGRRCRSQKEISRFDGAELTQNFLPLDCPSPTQKANLLWWGGALKRPQWEKQTWSRALEWRRGGVSCGSQRAGMLLPPVRLPLPSAWQGERDGDQKPSPTTLPASQHGQHPVEHGAGDGGHPRVSLCTSRSTTASGSQRKLRSGSSTQPRWESRSRICWRKGPLALPRLPSLYTAGRDQAMTTVVLRPLIPFLLQTLPPTKEWNLRLLLRSHPSGAGSRGGTTGRSGYKPRTPRQLAWIQPQRQSLRGLGEPFGEITLTGRWSWPCSSWSGTGHQAQQRSWAPFPVQPRGMQALTAFPDTSVPLS